ncbi:MAG: hypothetical protein MUF34_24410 [Polyangiaceae bacterium]|nr:hypothetical protein [Polyangiaceae bacterium]
MPTVGKDLGLPRAPAPDEGEAAEGGTGGELTREREQVAAMADALWLALQPVAVLFRA